MRSCPNCGHEMPDDAPYCPACGTMIPAADPSPASIDGPEIPEAPQTDDISDESVGAPTEPQTGAAPQPENDVSSPTPGIPTAPIPVKSSGSGKKAIAIGAVALLAVGCIGTGIYFMGRGEKVPSSPAQQFKAAQTEYANTLFTSLERVASEKNTQTFSTDLTLTAQYTGDDTISGYLDGTSIDLKMDIKEDAALLGLNFVLRNNPIVSGILSYEDGVAGILVPEVAESWYTMDLVKFLENNAQGEEIPDLSKFTTPKFPAASIREAFTGYLDTILTAVTDDNTVKTENTSFALSLTGENVTGDVYTVTPTAKDLEAMLLKLADQLENDTQLVAIMDEYYGSTMELFDESALQSGEKTMAQQLDEALDEAAASLRKDAKDIAAALEAEHFTWTLRTAGKKTCCQAISADSGEVSWEVSGAGVYSRAAAFGEEVFRFELGKESLLFTMTSDGETISGSGTFKEEKGLWSGQFTMEVAPIVFTVSYHDVDVKKTSALELNYGSYAFTIEEGMNTGSMYLDVGTGKNGGTDHVFRFDFVPLDTPEFRLSDLTVCINSSDKPSTVTRPDAPQTDVTYYTEADFEALAESLSDPVSALIFKMLSALYS